MWWEPGKYCKLIYLSIYLFIFASSQRKMRSIIKHGWVGMKSALIYPVVYCGVLEKVSLTCSRCFRYPLERTDLAQLEGSFHLAAGVRARCGHSGQVREQQQRDPVHVNSREQPSGHGSISCGEICANRSETVRNPKSQTNARKKTSRD